MSDYDDLGMTGTVKFVYRQRPPEPPFLIIEGTGVLTLDVTDELVVDTVIPQDGFLEKVIAIIALGPMEIQPREDVRGGTLIHMRITHFL